MPHKQRKIQKRAIRTFKLARKLRGSGRISRSDIKQAGKALRRRKR